MRVNVVLEVRDYTQMRKILEDAYSEDSIRMWQQAQARVVGVVEEERK